MTGSSEAITTVPVEGTVIGTVGRWGHTTTRVGDTLYVVGGLTESWMGAEPEFANETLALPLTQSFHMHAPPLVRVGGTGGPQVAGHVGVAQGDGRVLVLGGSGPMPRGGRGWALGPVVGSEGGVGWSEMGAVLGTGRMEHAVAMGAGHEGWVWGGMADETTVEGLEEGTCIVLNDMYLLGAGGTGMLEGAWLGVPSGRYEHTLSTLPDGRVVVVGGTNGTHLSSMTEIYVFSPGEKLWTKHVANGEVPTPRRDHIAVVKEDNIIIHGGTDNMYTARYADVAVLSTDTWTWSTPRLSNPPPGRFGHTATLVGDLLLLINGYTVSGADNRMYGVDTVEWGRATHFNPEMNIQMMRRHPSVEEDRGGFGRVVGGVIGGVLGGALLVGLVIGLLIRRRRITESSGGWSGGERWGRRGGMEDAPGMPRWPQIGSVYPGREVLSREERIPKKFSSLFSLRSAPRTAGRGVRRLVAFSRSDELESHLQRVEVQVASAPRRSLYIANPDF